MKFVWETPEEINMALAQRLILIRKRRDLSDDNVFEEQLDQTVSLGIEWLKQYLVDDGDGGIREGLKHNVDSEGVQETAESVRTDCVGEATGNVPGMSTLSIWP